MASRPLRVLLDSNVLIGYLLTSRRDSPLVAILDAAFRREYTALVPEALLEEVAHAVGGSGHLTSRISPQRLHRLVTALQAVAEPVPRVTGSIPAMTRDTKDDYLLAYALLGDADYLVTGDRDLVVLDGVLGLRIITPSAFAALLASRSGRLP